MFYRGRILPQSKGRMKWSYIPIYLLNKVPGGDGAKVAVGTGFVCFLAALPVFFQSKNQKRGHDWFSAEKPQTIQESIQAKKEVVLQKGLPNADKSAA